MHRPWGTGAWPRRRRPRWARPHSRWRVQRCIVHAGARKCASIVGEPEVVQYAATYVELAAIVTGEAKVTCCQPEDVSPVNVPCASSVPLEL